MWLFDKTSISKSSKEPLFNTEVMLPISEIRGDTIILKDGGIRSVLRVTGINLDLRNPDEQEVIIEQYKKFLNGLDFPVQLLIRNTYLDLSMYLNFMKDKVSLIDNTTLQWFGQEYINFLSDIDLKQWLVYVKEFYMIVPFYDGGNDNTQVNKPRWSKILSVLDSKDSAEKIVERYRKFVKSRKFLDTRCNVLIDGLRAIGMPSERLEEEELIALMFRMYNPTVHSAQSIPTSMS